ncbi:MAG: hypothetical protein HQL46_13535, partial [Gammaproteobacteria bacterium]|nr:hypothetical protein [Gammaproteobacteria bacterium]
YENDTFFDKVVDWSFINEKSRFWYMVDLLQKLQPEFVICTKPNIPSTFYAYFLLQHKPVYTKFIFAPWGDIITYKTSSLNDEEMMDSFKVNFQTLKSIQYCEQYLLQKSDAVLSSYRGYYRDNVLLKETKKLLSTTFFIHPKNFVFSDNQSVDNIKICYAGSIDCAEDGSQLWQLIMDHSHDYRIIAEQSVYLDVYTFNSATLFCYEQLSQQSQYFSLYFNTPHWQLPQQLKGYHFGLVWSNISDKKNRQKLFPGDHSTFLAKALVYLAAGIPIIVCEGLVLMANFVKEHGLGIVVKNEDLAKLSELIKQEDYLLLKNKVKTFQQNYVQAQHELEISNFFKTF